MNESWSFWVCNSGLSNVRKNLNQNLKRGRNHEVKGASKQTDTDKLPMN